jgi:hypothetical protein
MTTKVTVRKEEKRGPYIIEYDTGVGLPLSPDGTIVHDPSVNAYFQKSGGLWNQISMERAYAESGTEEMYEIVPKRVLKKDEKELAPVPLSPWDSHRLGILRDFLAWVSENPEVQYRINLLTLRV